MLRLPGLSLTEDLALRIGAAEVRLRPTDGFRIAEALIRGSTRAAMLEEAAEHPRQLAPKQRARRKMAA